MLFVGLMSERHAAESQRASPRQYLSQASQCVAIRVDTGGNYRAAALSFTPRQKEQVPFERDINGEKKKQHLISSESRARLIPFKMER